MECGNRCLGIFVVVSTLFLGGCLSQDNNGRRQWTITVNKRSTPGQIIFRNTNVSATMFSLPDPSPYFRVDKETGDLYLISSLESFNQTSITFQVIAVNGRNKQENINVVIHIEVTDVNLILKPPDKVENGTDVNFTCEAHGFIEEPVFQWSVSNKTVTSGATDRLQVTTYQKDDVWISVLKFRPILYEDGSKLVRICSVSIHCSATGKGHNGSNIRGQASRFYVITIPSVVVAVEPKAVNITFNGEVNLTCALVDPLKSPAQMRWLKIQNGTESIVSESKGPVTRDVFTVSGLTENTEFVCIGSNTNGQGRSNTVIVLVETTGYVTSLVTTEPVVTTKRIVTTEPTVTIEPSMTTVTTGHMVTTKPMVTREPSITKQTLSYVVTVPTVHTLTSEPMATTKPMLTVEPTKTLEPSTGHMVTAKPMVTTEPSITKEPSIVTIPTVHTLTSEPMVTTKPMVTTEPSITKVTSIVTIPTVPTVTSEPMATTKPMVTMEPTKTLEPSTGHMVTTKPMVTTEPSITKEPSIVTIPTVPTVTSELMVTTKPMVTTEPSITKEPSIVTIPMVPTVTSELMVTTKPMVTTEPSITKVTSIVTVPTVTSEPMATTKPMVTMEPTKTLEPSTELMVTTKPMVTTEPSITKEPSIVTVPTVPTVTSELMVTTVPMVTTELMITAGPTVTTEPIITTEPMVPSEPTIITVPTVTTEPTVNTAVIVTMVPTVTTIPAMTTVTSDITLTMVPTVTTVPTMSTLTTATTIKCPQTTDENNVIWMETLSEQLAEAQCPNGFSGKSSRRCNETGQWENIDYDSDCSQTSLNIPLQKAQQIKDGVYEGDLGEVLKDLVDSMDPENMTSSDIDIILDVLESITEGYNRDENQTLKDEDVQSLITVVDAMLSVNESKWNNLIESDRRGPKSLMWCVDVMANAAIQRNPRFNKTYATDTIFFQIGSVKGEEKVSCPDFSGEYPSWLNEFITSTRMTEGSYPQMEEGKRVWWSGVIYRNIGAVMENQYLKEVDPQFTPSKIRDDMFVSSRGARKTSMKDVVSRVMSFSVFPKMEKLNPPLYITMQVSRVNSQPVCSFLNYNGSTNSSRTGNWSSEGCWEESRQGDVIVCACNHTTNFAILMSPVETVEDNHEYILGLISIVGCGVSLLFLLTTIVIYCMVWRNMVKTHVAKVKSILLMNLCVTLIISYTLFLAGVRLTQNKDVCTAVAALLHYFFLAVFCVMLAEGIHLFISIVIVVNFTSYLKSLYILIYATPALIVGITIGVVKVDSYTGQRFCWLSTEGFVIWAFVAPALLIILINTCILLVALRQMLGRKSWDDKIIKQGKYLARALAIILPIIGVTWVFGVFAINRDLLVFQYMFAICNSLQGVFIFIFHCCTSNVRAAFKEMRNRFHRQSMSKSTLRSGSTYRTKSSHESYPSVKSVNSNYTLSLTTKALRNNSDSTENPGSPLGRVVALPRLFDPDLLEVSKQRLIREDSHGTQGTTSPTSIQHINLGFADSARKRVAFSVGYSSNMAVQEAMESFADQETERRRRSITFLPVEDVPEAEVERELRRRRKAIDQMYDACDAFKDIRRAKDTETQMSRDRWRMAYDAIHSAKTFKVSSPPSSVIRGSEMTSPYDTGRFYMHRM